MNVRSRRTTHESKLDAAYEALQRHAHAACSRLLRRIRHPRGRKARLALGATFVGLGVLGPVLPVAGVWMIPLGLLLIAEELPRIQHPVAKLALALERQWLKLRSWWRRRFQAA